MPPTPTTPQDTQLESDLLTHLAATHALEDIHTTLLSSLQRLGWTEKIRQLSLELLRANRCERFDEVVEAVVASAQGRSHPSLDHHNAHNNGRELEAVDGGFPFEDVDVRIPSDVVEQGVRAIKDVLRETVILEDDADGASSVGSGGGGGSGSGGVNVNVEIGGGGDSTTGKRQGEKSLNGDTSPTKKADKKTKQGKQGK
ncbi:uncharacterized protein BJX67DRAFT_220016 [Aspergillus lucknowensis]|uniref:Uncharacterized protein n=1 Tax=Aspergillus lucknowensis TaxID=176173 RepID=A0ABR4LIR5_9EURO